MSKIERLLNLIALLLDTRRPLTAGEIREKIPGYGDQSDEAFHRMFERDKAEIRELGFAMDQQDADAWGEPGYRISRDHSLLEDLGLTPAEMAALSLAAQSWGGSDDGILGLLKLSVGTGVAEPGPSGWVLPRVPVDEKTMALADAIARRKRVQFDYQTGGGGTPQRRTVDPYGLSHRGAWYLGGYDHDRGEIRHFKVARIAGSIAVKSDRAPDFDPPPGSAVDVRRGPWEGEPRMRARIAFLADVVWWVERSTGARRAAEREDGRVELEMDVADPASYAAWIAGFGSAALVVEPDELRLDVIERLRRLAEA